VFFDLDRLFSTCPDPACLDPEERFNGWAFIEKRNVSPHVHILISCRSWTDQMWRSLFLLEALDNVTKERRDTRDDRWQRETRATIRARPWSSWRRWKPHQSVMPRGTAMVQVIRTADDLENVSRYVTKEWRYTTEQLALRTHVPLDDWAMPAFELREFFTHQKHRPARPWKRCADGSLELNLDKLAWRNERGIVKLSRRS